MPVASKNIFDVLGDNDGTEAVTAPAVKDNKDAKAPATGIGRARREARGNEAAYRDPEAGSSVNRTRKTEEEGARGPRGGAGARRAGGRGGGRARDRNDRHSRSAPGGGSDKQAAQSWGATEGKAELKDEQAGDEIAKTEKKEDVEGDAAETAAPAEDAEPEEPEVKQVSYQDYLAQQAEKKLALEDSLEIRQANEGSKLDKSWAGAKAFRKDEEDEAEYMAPIGGKTKRERERKVKNVLEIDQSFQSPPERRTSGPRGDFRGGERRGGYRGDREDRGDRGGDRAERGERSERRGGRGGEFRGRGEGRGPRRGDGEQRRGGGEQRTGGRGGNQENKLPYSVTDTNAFPTLGN